MAINKRASPSILYAMNWLLILLANCHVYHGTQTDVFCLKKIKESLQDPHNYLDSWDFTNTNEGFICNFIGIECWNALESRVLNIRLNGMGLKGKFPLGIGNCTSLTGLDLSGNRLSGPIPSNISKLIGFATMLDLSSNSFSGEIPENLAKCVYLNVVKLDHNQLSGRIPSKLGSLSRIRTFSVANNHLYGPVPRFNVSIPKESYANNTGLCGAPLDPCPTPPRKFL